MFQVNDVIQYGAQGVCKITDIEEKTINKVKKTYFVLKPINVQGPTIYVPTDNEYVLSKMRKLLTESEINSLIDSMPDKKAVWISNENARKEHFKRVLASGDHAELIKMIKSIYAHKQQRVSEGKRLHVSDEHFFKDAEQILYNEFQYVLKLSSKEELMTYILERIK